MTEIGSLASIHGRVRAGSLYRGAGERAASRWRRMAEAAGREKRTADGRKRETPFTMKLTYSR